jgi:hypothetical protein
MGYCVKFLCRHLERPARLAAAYQRVGIPSPLAIEEHLARILEAWDEHRG